MMPIDSRSGVYIFSRGAAELIDPQSLLSLEHAESPSVFRVPYRPLQGAALVAVRTPDGKLGTLQWRTATRAAPCKRIGMYTKSILLR